MSLTRCRALRRLRDPYRPTGVSQVELAARSRTSLGTVRKLEAGGPATVEKMDLGPIIRIADALGVSPAVLMPRLGLTAAEARLTDWSPATDNER